MILQINELEVGDVIEFELFSCPFYRVARKEDGKIQISYAMSSLLAAQQSSASQYVWFTQSNVKKWSDVKVVHKTNNIKHMNLIEKAKLIAKGEPEKSFIKSEVMTMAGDFTQEGQQLFLTFLVAKYGDDFKKEVIDPIMNEEVAAKKD